MNPGSLTMEVRLAGAILRHHREAVRLSVVEAAAELGCDPSKISRIETGQRRVMPGEMLRLLEAYRVPAAERAAAAALTRAARGGWWSEYQGLLPDAVADQAVAEAVTGEVMAYDPQAVPAFLRSGGYAAAVAGADPALGSDDERRLAARFSAQRARRLRGRAEASVAVVLGEAALVHEAGGSEVMPRQLRQLAGEAGLLAGRGTLRVVPFSAGAHPGISTGALTVIRFPGVRGVGAVWRGGEVSVVRQAELTRAVRAFEAIRDAALSAEGSRQLVRTVIEGWQ